jgi:predicted nucleic acid-binding protein
VIDTSVMVAGLFENHEFNGQARPYVAASARGQVPGIVLAETWASIRRPPWSLNAADASELLAPWMSSERLVATPVEVYVETLRSGRALNMGGGIHDMLIARTCAALGLGLVTLDRRQATLARSLPGLDVNLLLPEDEP